MSNYLTLSEFKLRADTQVSTKDDTILLAIEEASRFLEDNITGRGRYQSISKMYPYVGPKYFDALPRIRSAHTGILKSSHKRDAYRDPREKFWITHSLVNSGWRSLDLRKYEFVGTPEITIAQGDTITSDDFRSYPLNDDCKDEIILVEYTSKGWLSPYPEGAITISGVDWVKRTTPGNGWRSTGVTLTEDLDSSSLDITVSNGSLFEGNVIIKIDNEVMNVLTEESNIVTVMNRGDNGSEATEHSSGTVVYYYVVESAIKEAVLNLTRLFIKKPGATTAFPQSGAIVREDLEYISRAKNLALNYTLGPIW